MNRLVGFFWLLLLCFPTSLASSQTEGGGADAYFFDQPLSTGQRLQLFLHSYSWADRWEVGGKINEPAKPPDNPVLQRPDIQQVLDEFEAEFERSAIRNKFTIDTSQGTKEETLARFLAQFEPYLNESDKLRILTYKASLRGEWI